ncbi:unnamed protein product [Rotaria socialis]|uniref:Uncharacterized protein n=3 Tax=Rotaria socialis TaxID=392032 RepID=A0A820C000_9BILA|nr:unnamed protein product [Rotaria socialis]CAF4214665.1 unnamed protein product [Rotaria socialis]CAF4253479.1 unnamed protein product [Rotaria socialis]
MAAQVQTYVRKVEDALKGYLYDGPLTPLWSLVEQKTKLKRERVALGLLGFVAIYLVLGWANDFICNFIGFIYPAYASVLAVESTPTHDDTEWLIYWIVYASFGFVEYIGYVFFHSLPFYWFGKCIFLLWLMAPGERGGSHILYHRFVRPFVLKHQSVVDKHIQDGSTKSSMSFEDRRVCRPFLLNCCPHEILSGTRVDLGECTKIHEYALRADYERAATTRNLYYEMDALDMLSKFVAECDRKTEHAKRKLQETQEELGEEAARKMNTIHELGEQIGTKLAKAEELGAQGLVDESMKLLEEVEALRKAKLEAEQEFRSTMPASTYQQQKLRVCEVCSAYLGIHDNDRRLADHFGGKLHLGFIQIREKLDDLKKRVNELNEKRELERKSRRTSPPPASSSRNDRRGDDKDKKDHRPAHRSRSRSKKASSRDRDRRESRSRSDRHSSKYSRSHRSSRSPSHSRRHSKRSRSRSGSSRRHRRSRSRSNTSSSKRHHRHRHHSKSPVHSSSHSKHNGNGDSQHKDKPDDNASTNHVEDDEETTRILEYIQRTMKEDKNIKE